MKQASLQRPFATGAQFTDPPKWLRRARLTEVLAPSRGSMEPRFLIQLFTAVLSDCHTRRQVTGKPILLNQVFRSVSGNDYDTL